MTQPTIEDLLDCERLWPGWTMQDVREEYYEWEGSIYGVIEGSTLCGPFDTLDDAIRQSAGLLTLALQFGESVLVRREESSYGLYGIYVLRYGEVFAVRDDVDDSSYGPFDSLEEAVDDSNVLMISEATESIDSTEWVFDEILAHLTFWSEDVASEHRVAINGRYFSIADLYGKRSLPDADILAERLLELLEAHRKALKESVAEPISEPTYLTPARSFLEHVGRQMEVGRQREAQRQREKELRRLARIMPTAKRSSPEELAALLRSKYPEAESLGLDDLEEALRRKHDSGKAGVFRVLCARRGMIRRPPESGRRTESQTAPSLAATPPGGASTWLRPA